MGAGLFRYHENHERLHAAGYDLRYELLSCLCRPSTTLRSSNGHTALMAFNSFERHDSLICALKESRIRTFSSVAEIELLSQFRG